MTIKSSVITSFLMLAVFQQTMAQDSTGTNIKSSHKHEIGANFTMLMKQVLNLSGNTIPTLPYDLTYKYKLNCYDLSIRAGLGIQVNNSTIKTTLNSTSSTNTTPAPDPVVPNINESFNVFYRVGVDRRVQLDKRIVFYYGLDFAAQNGRSTSQSSITFNSLPTGYSYSKTLEESKTTAYGGGAVAGIQLFLTKRLNLFTEVPFYVFASKQTLVAQNYSNFLTTVNPGNQTFVSSSNKNTVETKSLKFTITLPVTIYLAFTL